jgi:hypothetical protein
MKKLLITTVAAIAAFASTAQADMTLASKGYWRTFAITSNDHGTPICGMETTMQKGNVSEALMVKAQGDTDALWVQFFKTSWKFPADGKAVDVPLNFKLDNGDHFDAAANGFMAKDKTGSRTISVVEFKIDPDFKAEFLESLAHASSVAVTFKQGNEGSWTIKMDGSRDAVMALKKCASNLPSEETATQPFDNTSTSKNTSKDDI